MKYHVHGVIIILTSKFLFQLNELYGETPGFVKAEVTGYRQGSVIVEFQIHYSEGSRVSIDTIQRPLEETAQPFGHIRVDPNSVYIQGECNMH